jgi:hypothetical protein
MPEQALTPGVGRAVLGRSGSVPSFQPASEVFRVLYVKGEPFEMGRRHGELLRDEIAYAVRRCVERFALIRQGWDRDALLAAARRLEQALPRAYREEIQGIRAGSGVPHDDLLLWNFMDDYWEVCGCSAFAVQGARTASGELLVGHNMDYPEDGSHAAAVTIVRAPARGWPSLCHTWAGVAGTYEGMNLRGLVTANQFSETADVDPDGVPIKILHRMILEGCAQPTEAAALVRSLRRDFGSNLLLADPETALVLECSGRDVTPRPSHDGALAVTNHYCALVPSQPQDTSSYKTVERLEALELWLAEAREPLDVKQCIARLDSAPIRRDGPPDNWTISSAVYEPGRLRAHLAHGFLPASRGEFVQIRLPEVLEGPEGLRCFPYRERVAEGRSA